MSFSPRRLIAGAAAALACFGHTLSAGAESAACLNSDPAAWPQPSKPYFMVILDTSGSMDAVVGNPAIASSCGFGTDRRAHARCALRRLVEAFGGEVNFGLATYPRQQYNCGATCYGTCQYGDYPNNQTNSGCGPGTGVNRRGAFIRVPMLQDSFWQVPPPASNASTLLSWADNSCTGNVELFADGFTPLNGALRDMKRYFSSTGWTAQDNSVTYSTPLASQDLAGNGINGSTGCRSVNILFLTDGGETCDTTADAVAAAADLYNNGVTVGGKTFKVRTFMVNFAGAGIYESNQIAAAGGTGTSLLANNETELMTALSNVVQGAIKPEVCDNDDNNCNGCTDESFRHYCNVGQTCCAWSNTAQRTTCLSQYTATITPATPGGDLSKLPCITAAQGAQPASWLCFNPGDSCDGADNNCVAGPDESCGAGSTTCTVSPEVCDGCDNDCDGMADDGVAPIPCGQASPGNCVGTVSCSPAIAVPIGGCVAGRGWGTCSNIPAAEDCDGADNDCDGLVDEDVAPVPCVPAGTPPNLDYGPNSQCKKGVQACGSNVCRGFIAPSSEVCDGIDNDCDGVVDEHSSGAGQLCGLSISECSAGVMSCVNGALVCQGAVGPTA
ncbi:MAG: hypothetical protein HY901_19315, partial [Deltaproteobacteria bacterium]|nr:hypothetical protein [Deltaproteobacteria bacterium]